MFTDAWLLFVLSSFAVYRLTRLAVDDEFPPIRAARDAVVSLQVWRTRYDGPHADVTRLRGYRLAEALGDLVTCRYCASGWIALGGTVALQTAGNVNLGWTFGALWWLATWGAAVVIYNYAAPDECETSQPEVDDAAVTRAAISAVDDLVDRVTDVVNERLVTLPNALTASGRDHVLAGIAQSGLAGALRHVLAEIPATHRAALVADVLRELNGSSTATTSTGTLPA